MNDSKQKILQRDKFRCVCCSSTKLLHIHHIIPFEFGGSDSSRNLVTVCQECHVLIHKYGNSQNSQKKNLELSMNSLSKSKIAVNESVLKVILKFSKIIAATRDKFPKTALEGKIASSSQNSIGLYSLQDAIKKCIKKNKHLNTVLCESKIMDIISNVWFRIPNNIRLNCSIASTHRGQTIAINHRNHLILRVPSRPDLGRIVTTPDIILIATLSGSLIKKYNSAFDFSLFEACNVAIPLEEVCLLTSDDWNDFSHACVLADQAQKTRNRRSNIDPLSIPSNN